MFAWLLNSFSLFAHFCILIMFRSHSTVLSWNMFNSDLWWYAVRWWQTRWPK